jgi:hypothetical protein
LFCRYKFNCQDPGIETTQELQYNEWQLWVNWESNPWESGNIPFLENIPVECPENQLLNSFQVKLFSFSHTIDETVFLLMFFIAVLSPYNFQGRTLISSQSFLRYTLLKQLLLDYFP